MTAREVLEACRRSWVIVSKDGANLRLEAIDPVHHPIGDPLVAGAREHKAELLGLLDYEARADQLLLESTRRIGEAWPDGLALDSPAWEECERTVHDAYWSGDLDRLQEALASREQLAYQVFGHSRRKVGGAEPRQTGAVIDRPRGGKS
jgi:hypothetical protein